MTSEATEPIRNGTARAGLLLWILSVGVFLAALVFGLINGTRDGEFSDVSAIIYPYIASLAYAPLLFIGVVVSGAALLRSGRPRRMAIVALLLNVLTLPFAAIVLVSALSAMFGG